jgi:hypothetical protein
MEPRSGGYGRVRANQSAMQARLESPATMALAIAQAERSQRLSTRCNHDGSLFQIDLDWQIPKVGRESPYDCLVKAKVATELFDRQGWSPWVTSGTWS